MYKLVLKKERILRKTLLGDVTKCSAFGNLHMSISSNQLHNI